LIAEEFAYGCSGIETAVTGTSLGVSTAMFIHSCVNNVTFYCLGLITNLFLQSAVFVVVKVLLLSCSPTLLYEFSSSFYSAIFFQVTACVLVCV
jgi:hypothetical protein